MADEGRKRKMQRKKVANLMKNLFKKIGALLVAAVMVLSMCTVAFAATKNYANIRVNGADNAKLTYVQVVEPDQTTRTGWNFVGGADGAIARAYMEGYSVNDAQNAIDALIANLDASKLGKAQALAARAAATSFTTMSNPQRVDKAGIYLIKAEEKGYTYNIMSAYVAFGEVTKDGEKFAYPSLVDPDPIQAKKTEIKVDKITTDSDNVTHTGDILTYRITTNVPYIAPTDEKKTFWVYDKLTGATYNEDATIKLGDTDVTADYDIDYTESGKFKVNLSHMINDANSNAGTLVTIEYTVTVTSENDTITNKATAGHEDGEEYGNKEIKTYEGNITLTKKNKDREVLAKAEFEVRKDSDSNALSFVRLTNGDYKFVPADYTPAEGENVVTTLVTNTNGQIKVKGLDIGTYHFKETKAPTGYSVNTTDTVAKLKVTEADGVASAILTNDKAEMIDTKLNALPSTGGMGTYLFTIIGVVVMAGAAGAFFISRRKGSEE